MRLKREETPFKVRERLHEHFNEYLKEYGACAAQSREMDGWRIWSITNADDVLGYV
jgi:hypothetical protein